LAVLTAGMGMGMGMGIGLGLLGTSTFGGAFIVSALLANPAFCAVLG
jgi:hypothetical protein